MNSYQINSKAISMRQHMEEHINKDEALLQALYTAQSTFIKGNVPVDTILYTLLHTLLEITGSEYGCISRVTGNVQELPFISVVTVADALRQRSRDSFEKETYATQPKLYSLQSLFKKVASSRKPVIVNKQPISLPQEYADETDSFYTFLAVPILLDDRLTGIVGIANSLSGYSKQTIQFLKPFADTCALFMESVQHGAILQLPGSIAGQKQTTLLQSMLESAPVGYYVVDHYTDDILYANHEFCKIWQIEHLEASIRRGILKHKDILSYCLRLVADSNAYAESVKALQNNTSEQVFEDEIRLAEQKTLRRYSAIIPGQYNRTKVRLYLFEDITLRKNQELKLIRAKQDAEESAVIKQQFLSSMSHEIRTPMNAVIGMTHLLLRGNPKPEQIEDLKTLKFSSENLLVLINDILDFSKIEAGKLIFEDTDFNLRELLYSIKNSHTYKSEEKGIKINVRLDSELPDMVVGDSVRLSQVLNNLLSNAIKFTHKGNVTIDVMVESDEGESLKINFAVIDTGIGISEDKIEYVFESYTQASSETTRKFGGTGLGLSITKRLLELQGSQIHVDSTEGVGSVFYFTLSFKRSLKEQVVASNDGINLAEVDLSHIKLLLVEDNEINQMVATKFLKQLNIKPDYAGNGIVAVEKVQAKNYDIVLMDLQMPVMDGYEATQTIRALPAEKYKKLPIIAVTAAVVLDTETRAQAAGITDFTAKPINPSELYKKILQYVGNISQDAEAENSYYMQPKEVNTENMPSFNYMNLIEICAGDLQAQNQILTMAMKSFEQFKHNYENALLTKNAPALESANHYMKTLFHVLNAKELMNETHHGVEMLRNERTTQLQLDNSIDKVLLICNQVMFDLEQMLLQKLRA